MSKLMFRGNEIADVTYTSGGGGGGGLQDVLTLVNHTGFIVFIEHMAGIVC